MFLLLALIFAIICALLAYHKGRNPIGWFFVGFFFGLFGLIILLVVANLKEAKAKEKQMQMEQRRLQEQLRQERLKNEQFRKHAQMRLDVHDQELKVDTRLIANELPVMPLQLTENPKPNDADAVRTFDIDGNPVESKDPMDDVGKGSSSLDYKDIAGGWYFRDGHNSIGPMALTEIKNKIQRGEITPKTHLWHPTFLDWIPAENVDALRFGD